MYTKEKIEKIGNSIVYLANNIKGISKTKLLKMLYFLDETSLKRSGIPFFNLEYKVWKFGPVSNEIFVELSSSPSMLKEYINREVSIDGHTYISAKCDFKDDEFSQNDLDLLEYIVEKYKDATVNELITLTHNKNSPWYNAAIKNKVYDSLMNEEISCTDHRVDLMELVNSDERKKKMYQDYLDQYV